jgi:hypothetical protein
VSPSVPDAPPPAWLDASVLPELVVELREPGIEADAANNAP